MSIIFISFKSYSTNFNFIYSNRTCFYSTFQNFQKKNEKTKKTYFDVTSAVAKSKKKLFIKGKKSVINLTKYSFVKPSPSFRKIVSLLLPNSNKSKLLKIRKKFNLLARKKNNHYLLKNRYLHLIRNYWYRNIDNPSSLILVKRRLRNVIRRARGRFSKRIRFILKNRKIAKRLFSFFKYIKTNGPVVRGLLSGFRNRPFDRLTSSTVIKHLLTTRSGNFKKYIALASFLDPTNVSNDSVIEKKLKRIYFYLRKSFLKLHFDYKRRKIPHNKVYNYYDQKDAYISFLYIGYIFNSYVNTISSNLFSSFDINYFSNSRIYDSSISETNSYTIKQYIYKLPDNSKELVIRLKDFVGLSCKSSYYFFKNNNLFKLIKSGSIYYKSLCNNPFDLYVTGDRRLVLTRVVPVSNDNSFKLSLFLKLINSVIYAYKVYPSIVNSNTVRELFNLYSKFSKYSSFYSLDYLSKIKNSINLLSSISHYSNDTSFIENTYHYNSFSSLKKRKKVLRNIFVVHILANPVNSHVVFSYRGKILYSSSTGAHSFLKKERRSKRALKMMVTKLVDRFERLIDKHRIRNIQFRFSGKSTYWKNLFIPFLKKLQWGFNKLPLTASAIMKNIFTVRESLEAIRNYMSNTDYTKVNTRTNVSRSTLNSLSVVSISKSNDFTNLITCLLKNYSSGSFKTRVELRKSIRQFNSISNLRLKKKLVSYLVNVIAKLDNKFISNLLSNNSLRRRFVSSVILYFISKLSKKQLFLGIKGIRGKYSLDSRRNYKLFRNFNTLLKKFVLSLNQAQSLVQYLYSGNRRILGIRDYTSVPFNGCYGRYRRYDSRYW